MNEDKKKKKLNFISAGDSSNAGVCGPDGCNIADHQKLADEQKKKDNK